MRDSYLKSRISNLASQITRDSDEIVRIMKSCSTTALRQLEILSSVKSADAWYKSSLPKVWLLLQHPSKCVGAKYWQYEAHEPLPYMLPPSNAHFHAQNDGGESDKGFGKGRPKPLQILAADMSVRQVFDFLLEVAPPSLSLALSRSRSPSPSPSRTPSPSPSPVLPPSLALALSCL
eukprot:6182104-Pleurochrysis_carterae.AAC.2